MDPKPIYQSKTVIFNALVLAGTALTALANHELVANNPRAFAWVMFGVTLVNGVLRLVTTQPVVIPK